MKTNKNRYVILVVAVLVLAVLVLVFSVRGKPEETEPDQTNVQEIEPKEEPETATEPTGSGVQRSFTLGTLNGTVATAFNGEVVEQYKGIPYAMFDYRYSPSRLCTDALGDFDADTFAPAPYQPMLESVLSNHEYDCLGLNIYTPKMESEEALPVYVWIYGGANLGGSSDISLYDFTNLAASGIVCVTFNYRVNSLGFSVFEREDGSLIANAALSDMINALEWVQKYIDDFGGDPRRVTIGGQSAGAYNVSYLLASSKAEGLFSQAIMESGGDLGWSKEQGIEITKDFASYLSGRQVESSWEALDILSQGDPDEVTLWNFASFKDPSMYYMLDAYALQDGEYLPENSFSSVLNSDFNHANMLIGQNANEYTMYLFEDMTMEYFDKMVESYFGEAYISEFRDHFGLKDDSGEEAIKEAIMIMGNVCLLYDSYLFADAQSKEGMNTYCYYYQYLSKEENARHTMEVPLVYKNFDTAPDEDTSTLSDVMYTAWTNFIRFGDPNGETGDALPVAWQPYTPEEKQIMIFDKECVMADFQEKEKEMVSFVLETLYQYSFE